MTRVLAAVGRTVTTTPDAGSPGILGFVATFLLALAVIGLMLSLTRHVRRVAASPEPPDPDGAAPDGAAPDAHAPGEAAPGEGDGAVGRA